jgi:hypothetical protein
MHELDHFQLQEDPNQPVKYNTGWAENNTRNSIGTYFAGGGTLAIAIASSGFLFCKLRLSASN